MVMGDTLEAALRQTLGRSEGSIAPFLTRPMALAMVVMIVLILLWPWLRRALEAWRGRGKG
jgi:TctA family transporter